MYLPFTEDQFLHTFGAFNQAVWPALVLLWIASLLVTVHLARATTSGRIVAAFLTLHWIWSGAIYFAWFFRSIAPGGWLFAVLFVGQGVLFMHAAIRRSLSYTWEPSLRQVTGLALLVAALAYPALTLLGGHAWPNAPLFGVPCPTLVFTAGALLCARPPVPRSLLIVPLLWAPIGGSAALTLGIRHDLLLVIAGAMLVPLLLPASWLRAIERWGATAMDVMRPMSGDSIAPHPAYEMTLSRVAQATPGDVWPWLLQLGYRRGGLYSYDWLDRLFGYLDRPSATTILPDFQHLAPGDTIPIGRGAGFPVRIVDPGHTLVLGGEERGTRWSWEIELEPIDGAHTRITSRSRGEIPHSLGSQVFMALLGPAAFVMTRRMLKGLEVRAERLHATAHA